LNEPKILKGIYRKQLLDQLHQRYASPTSFRTKMRYWRKKYLWLFFVEGARGLKRLFDILISSFLLLFLGPLMLVIALTIKLVDGGPAFYISRRVGKWGKEISFPKFRTMMPGADQLKNSLETHKEHNEDVTFKMAKDPRVTKVGYWLRKSSLDELPQLWTVLKGEMTLVGPRPPLPEEVARYTLDQRRRLDVKPGLTCLWQVSGRSEIPFKKQVELDIEYIESQSLLLDLKLILKTIPAVLFGRGAY
jgi:lipopolysaccharide/colanic/teichoic acid biosynthesis glycosyltransferase